MPLCTDCRAKSMVFPTGGYATRKTTPPYGMEWGDTCDECGVTAEVSFDA